MYRTAIVTDTNSGISPQQAEAMGISLIPMPFLVDGKLCLEGRDCTPEEFFQQLRAGADVSTSQPAPEEILELWETLLKDHDAVLHFPMSSGLSGSCQTAKALAREYDGRVTAAGAAMASVLNIKPVLQIQGDKLDAFKKVRGMRQAETAMLKAMKSDLETRFAGEKPALFAVYSGDKAPGDQWLEQVRAFFPDWQVEQGVLPLSICCHVGEGALAIACAKKR